MSSYVSSATSSVTTARLPEPFGLSRSAELRTKGSAGPTTPCAAILEMLRQLCAEVAKLDDHDPKIADGDRPIRREQVPRVRPGGPRAVG